MAYVVTHRPLTAEAWVRSQANLYEFCGGKSGADIGFSLSTSVSPISIILRVLSIHFHLHVSLTKRTKGRSLGTFENAVIFSEILEHYLEKYFYYF
jgi:hypothetical protein